MGKTISGKLDNPWLLKSQTQCRRQCLLKNTRFFLNFVNETREEKDIQ
jgi:hypothetical protein